MLEDRLSSSLLLLFLLTNVVLQPAFLMCGDVTINSIGGGVRHLIEEILNILGISNLSVGLRYSYYYGGRPLQVCGEELKKLGILGLNSSDLVVGVFVNNSWRELPYRVFVDKIEAFNGYIQYVISPIVTESSCLELILPAEIPEKGDLTQVMLPQVRGSKVVEAQILISDEAAKYAIPLYLFINPVMKDRERSIRFSYDYNPRVLGMISPYRTHEKLHIIELVNEERNYLREKLHLTSKDFEELVSYLMKELHKPINSEVKSIEVLEPGPPGLIPDGGGDFITYNYVERTPVLFNNLVWVGGLRVPQTVITLTSTNRSYSSNYYLTSSHHSWQVYNPYVTIFSVKLRVYGNDTSSRTLRVTIDGEQKTYTIYPSLVNEVLVSRYYYDYPGRNPSQPITYDIAVEPSISSGRVWKIEGEVITYYSLNTSAVRRRIYNGTYDVDLFSVTDSWLIILRPSTHGNFNYTYSVTSLLPTPYGGYIDDGTNMGSVSQDYLNMSLGIRASTSPVGVDWTANYTLRVCLGGLLCGSTRVFLTKLDNHKDITVKVMPTMSPAPRLPLYRWLVSYLYTGHIPLTIELKPNNLVNIYPNHFYVQITPYINLNYSNYRVRFYYKNVVSNGLENPSIRHYTALYTCAPNYGCDTEYAADRFSPYAHLLIGVMRADVYVNNIENVYRNEYTSSSAYISISRESILGIGRREIYAKLDFSLGLPSIISEAGNQDLSIQAKYNKFKLTLSSYSGVYMGETTLLARFYDPGPGADLPNHDEIASRIAFISGIISLTSGPAGVVAGAVATLFEVFALGYSVYKASLTNEVRVVERTDSTVIVEYQCGSATSTSAPLTVRLNNFYINDVPAVLHIEVTIQMINPEVYPGTTVSVTKSVSIDM